MTAFPGLLLSRYVRATACLALGLLLSANASWAQRVLRWTDMNAAQLASLDRNRTVVLIPAGIVQEQGTLLPTGSEMFHAEKLSGDLALSLATRPGWTVLVLPTIPLGTGAFDQRMQRGGFSGSLPLRATTVQAIFTDIGMDLGAQGFQHLFIIDGHNDGTHARALDLAGEAFAASYRGQMIHLLGRAGCNIDGLEPPPITLYSATAMTADTDSPHGGTRQTARNWWLRQDLVDSTRVRLAPDMSAGAADARSALARRSDWPGYIGAPRFATLELGQWLYETELRNCSALAQRFLDGLPEQSVARLSDRLRADPTVRAAMDAALSRVSGDSTHRQRSGNRGASPR